MLFRSARADEGNPPAQNPLSRPRLLHTLRGHERWVLSLSFSPDGNRLASGGDDQTLRVWNLHTTNSQSTLRRFDSAVTAVAFHPGGKSIAVGTHDGHLELCDAKTGNPLRKFAGHDEAITVVRFDPTGR